MATKDSAKLLAQVFGEDVPLLKEALAREPLPGPWRTNAELPGCGGLEHLFVGNPLRDKENIVCRIRNEVKDGPLNGTDVANALFIAAAEPDRIKRLLDALDILTEKLGEISSSRKK